MDPYHSNNNPASSANNSSNAPMHFSDPSQQQSQQQFNTSTNGLGSITGANLAPPPSTLDQQPSQQQQSVSSSSSPLPFSSSVFFHHPSTSHNSTTSFVSDNRPHFPQDFRSTSLPSGSSNYGSSQPSLSPTTASTPFIMDLAHAQLSPIGQSSASSYTFDLPQTPSNYPPASTMAEKRPPPPSASPSSDPFGFGQVFGAGNPSHTGQGSTSDFLSQQGPSQAMPSFAVPQVQAGEQRHHQPLPFPGEPHFGSQQHSHGHHSQPPLEIRRTASHGQHHAPTGHFPVSGPLPTLDGYGSFPQGQQAQQLPPFQQPHQHPSAATHSQHSPLLEADHYQSHHHYQQAQPQQPGYHQQPSSHPQHPSPHPAMPAPMPSTTPSAPSETFYAPPWEPASGRSPQPFRQQSPEDSEDAEPMLPPPVARPMRAPEKRQQRDKTTTRLLCKLRFLGQLQSYVGGRLVDIETLRFTSQNRQVSSYSLFVEVVSRGGFARVTAERRWTEVATVLNCLFTHHAGQALKQRYDDMGLQKLEEDTILVEECLDFGTQEAGVHQAGLPSRALTPIELVVFPEFGRDAMPYERERYLDARDHVLQRWCLEAEKIVRFERRIMSPLRGEFNEEILSLFPLKKAFFAMETLGFTNWGCLSSDWDPPMQFVGGDGTPKTFIVLGAGLAGLACAIQLSKFGHEVHLVEGRDRVGGRVYTDRKTFSAPVDLGAMLITGVQGHPASVLTHQLQQKKYAVGDACPIYSLGEILDPEMDARIETRFNAMLTAAARAAHGQSGEEDEDEEESGLDGSGKDTRKRGRSSNYSSLNQRSTASDGIDGEPRSKYSGVHWNPQTNRWRVCLTRRSTGAREWLGNATAGKEFDDELEAAAFHDAELVKKPVNAFSDFRNTILFGQDFTGDARISAPISSTLGTMVPDKTDSSSEQARLFGGACAVQAQREIDRLKRTRTDASGNRFSLSSIRRLPPVKDDYSLMERMMEEDSAFAMQQSEDQRRLEDAFLSWHFANLEYACAASLNKVSAANWDQDDEHDWEGSHVMLPNGFGAITEGMQRYLVDTAKGRAHVHLSSRAQKVSTTPSGGVSVIMNSGKELTGSGAVCTVSLGVLKEGALKFEPPLPQWKLGAIARLGYGNMNKVVLEFDNVFWDESHDIFGRVVHPHVGSRGECFMFWCLNKLNPAPIILALVAGDAAEEQEYRPDHVVAQRALSALRETFPTKVIPEPKAYAVTRWRADPFSRGTYSFVAVGSSGEDYSLLAEQTHDGRLYFAGEATCREHPATTGGALVSGLREAAKIAAKFGRTVTVGQAEEGLREVLERIGEGLSLHPGKLPTDKMVMTEKVLTRMGQGKIWTGRDFESFHNPNVATETWQHVRFPPNFLQTNRERALRAAEIMPRLPDDWNETRKLAYIAERLGMSEWKQGDEIGCWV